MHLLRTLVLSVFCWAALAASAACVAPAAPAPEAAELTVASARLLAGLAPVGAHGRDISATDFWAAHAAAMDAAWRRTRERQLAVWRAFGEREIDALEGSRGALYYPFSGPDFLYAHTLFPRAQRYLLVGLEPPGAAPGWSTMNEAQAAASLSQLRQSTSTLLRLSFFRTIGMKSDLARGRLQGVAPVLMAMAALSGFEVRAVDEVHLDADGALCMGVATDGRIGGVRLALAEPGATALRELVYLRVDLCDRALAGTPQFERYLRSLGPGPVFLKAASYLMHKSYFNTSRSLVLERAKLVVQDDSGIPYQAYGPTEWKGRFFGSYSQPIGLFKGWKQPDLREAYARGAQPLDTGIGYSHRRGTSNLQVFEKRGAKVASRQPAMQ